MPTVSPVIGRYPTLRLLPALRINTDIEINGNENPRGLSIDVAHIAGALEAGANEYIMKPFDKDIIANKFQEVGLIRLPEVV